MMNMDDDDDDHDDDDDDDDDDDKDDDDDGDDMMLLICSLKVVGAQRGSVLNYLGRDLLEELLHGFK